MAEKKTNSLRLTLTWAGVTLGVLALVAVLAIGACAAYARMYENRIFPGVRALEVRLDGLTKSEAQTALQGAVDNALSHGLRFKYKGREVAIDATTVSTEDADAARDLLKYEVDKMVEQAYGLGRDSGVLRDAWDQLELRFDRAEVAPAYYLDRDGLSDALAANFKRDLQEARGAYFKINDKAVPPLVTIEPERKGTALVTGAALDELERQAQALKFTPISLNDQLQTEGLTAKDLEPLLPQVQKITAAAEWDFTYASDTYRIANKDFAGWISATATDQGAALTLDQDKFGAGLKAVAGKIEREGKDGGIDVKDGKIVAFKAGVEGLEIDVATTLNNVTGAWDSTTTFPLATKATKGKLVGQDPETLGIKDLLGTGYSKFDGSPRNRMRNIARAVELLNGTVIPPDTVFSLIDTMGEIDGPHGWFPEMVIKGNETKPEFGGGLCQIGTTVFRGAMKSGLPIVERANHSYRVRYYEPAGTDATVYGPHPDMRFKNDTGHPIYINAYQKGYELFFEYWGTSDGRKGEIGPSHVYNLVPPPPTKLVETLELKPGQKKCTEIAHTGADADFTYKVTFADGRVEERVFHSHYKPWQAVCLVGVEKLSDGTATTSSTTSQ